MNLEVEIQGQAGITAIKKKRASTLFLQTILKSFVYIIHPHPQISTPNPLKD